MGAEEELLVLFLVTIILEKRKSSSSALVDIIILFLLFAGVPRSREYVDVLKVSKQCTVHRNQYVQYRTGGGGPWDQP